MNMMTAQHPVNHVHPVNNTPQTNSSKPGPHRPRVGDYPSPTFHLIGSIMKRTPTLLLLLALAALSACTSQPQQTADAQSTPPAADTDSKPAPGHGLFFAFRFAFLCFSRFFVVTLQGLAH